MNKPKILYISHLLQNSGTGNAARNWLLALDLVFDVVARPVLLNGDILPENPRIKELIEKPSQPVDYCIQFLLPQYIEYGDFKKNIGIFMGETLNLSHHSWISKLNTVNLVLVPNSELKDNAQLNGITKPVELLPCAVDISVYNQPRNTLNFPLSGFKFYTISTGIERKNLAALIIAYYLEFTRNEPVVLIIKTDRDLTELCNEIKSKMRLYKNNEDYPDILCISHEMSDNQIQDIHYSCDCYVSASAGEGFCYPGLEAVAYGNSVISSDQGGPRDYLVNYSNGYLVSGRYEPVLCSDPPFYDLWTAREIWFSIDILELAHTMRKAFLTHENKREEGLRVVQNYSIENVAKRFEELVLKTD